MDSVAAQMDAAGVDKDEAYRRFEELLGTADVSFAQGDKVLAFSPSCRMVPPAFECAQPCILSAMHLDVCFR
jgi:hypothetical protein